MDNNGILDFIAYLPHKILQQNVCTFFLLKCSTSMLSFPWLSFRDSKST